MRSSHVLSCELLEPGPSTFLNTACHQLAHATPRWQTVWRWWTYVISSVFTYERAAMNKGDASLIHANSGYVSALSLLTSAFLRLPLFTTFDHNICHPDHLALDFWRWLPYQFGYRSLDKFTCPLPKRGVVACGTERLFVHACSSWNQCLYLSTYLSLYKSVF